MSILLVEEPGKQHGQNYRSFLNNWQTLLHTFAWIRSLHGLEWTKKYIKTNVEFVECYIITVWIHGLVSQQNVIHGHQQMYSIEMVDCIGSSIPIRGEIEFMQMYVIKFVSYLKKICNFVRAFVDDRVWHFVGSQAHESIL
jgi:hypothetical protein